MVASLNTNDVLNHVQAHVPQTHVQAHTPQNSAQASPHAQAPSKKSSFSSHLEGQLVDKEKAPSEKEKETIKTTKKNPVKDTKKTSQQELAQFLNPNFPLPAAPQLTNLTENTALTDTSEKDARALDAVSINNSAHVSGEKALGSVGDKDLGNKAKNEVIGTEVTNIVPSEISLNLQQKLALLQENKGTQIEMKNELKEDLNDSLNNDLSDDFNFANESSFSEKLPPLKENENKNIVPNNGKVNDANISLGSLKSRGVFKSFLEEKIPIDFKSLENTSRNIEPIIPQMSQGQNEKLVDLLKMQKNMDTSFQLLEQKPLMQPLMHNESLQQKISFDDEIRAFVKQELDKTNSEIKGEKNDKSVDLLTPNLVHEIKNNEPFSPVKIAMPTVDFTQKSTEKSMSVLNLPQDLTQKNIQVSYAMKDKALNLDAQPPIQSSNLSPVLEEIGTALKKGVEKKEDKKIETTTESLSLLGNNGEVISHSDIVTSNGPATPLDANTAVNKAIQISDQLKAAQGGSAKLQINDAALGKLTLQIDMKNPSSVNIYIHAENSDIKKKIEEKVDFLKQSLEMQKINLADFKVMSLDKSSSSQFNSSSQQDQPSQQQNFQSAFQQHNNNKGFQDHSSQGNNTHFVGDGSAKSLTNKTYIPVQKNSISNIQRSANGSIKVLA